MNTPTVLHGDALVHIRSLSDNSIDAVITDPPYNLAFMGKAWDDHKTGRAFQDWCEVWLRECLRVLKPGGHLLAFGGTRTWHRLASAAEDAGFEIRDSMAWLYGQGFPKSLDVSKAIDKAAGATREATGAGAGAGTSNTASLGVFDPTYDITAPATDAAKQWQGWGTALKPAFEPIVVARKPLTGTVAANVLAHGTGALNVDACRIGSDEDTRRNARGGDNGLGGTGTFQIRERRAEDMPETSGRWPANVILDEHTAAIVDEQSGVSTSGAAGLKGSSGFADGYSGEYSVPYGDTGGASRFFYNAKASKSERPVVNGIAHPTVKPIALMRWLVRLVAPPGGVVLDPFAGSGTTAEACILEGFDCIVIEREDDYLPLIDERINRNNPTLFTGGDVLV
jgi:site-specific DNA-methyltransferase (adenine-specific)